MSVTLDSLIQTYRMGGFDAPVFWDDETLGGTSMEITDPCGQWKFINASSPIECIKEALRWAKKNKKNVRRERMYLIWKYPGGKVKYFDYIFNKSRESNAYRGKKSGTIQ